VAIYQVHIPQKVLGPLSGVNKMLAVVVLLPPGGAGGEVSPAVAAAGGTPPAAATEAPPGPPSAWPRTPVLRLSRACNMVT
jgi:hypothetical protein